MGNLFPLTMKAGVQRDGTPFATRNYIDSVWMRFRRGLAQTIGGYKSLFYFDENVVPRGTIVVPYDEAFYIYYGTSNGLFYISVDTNFSVLSGPVDVTPDDFVESQDISWTFDLLFSSVDNGLMLIAHPGYNLNNINERTKAPVYFGVVGREELFQSTGQEVSGGVLVLPPFLVTLDNDGEIKISSENKPNVFENTGTRITAQKLIAGRETRGGQYSPGGLIWSTDTLIRLYFTGGATQFRADKIGKTSLISNNAIAELDNLFFWAGTDRFMFYNGTVNALPNDKNIDFFYKNINYEHRSKVWCAVVPEFNEIWWHFPKGDSTECNWAVIFNKTENTWYDTPIERTCGFFDYTFEYPVWFCHSGNTIKAYVHEYKVGCIEALEDGAQSYVPVLNKIETGSIGWCAIDPAAQWKGIDKQINLRRFEPDFIQDGNIQMFVKGKSYARSEVIQSGPYTIEPNTLKVDIHEQRREMTLLFQSYGYMQFGNPILDITFGDTRA